MSIATVGSVYSVLGEGTIRFLSLRPGTPDSPLKADLHTVRIQRQDKSTHTGRAISGDDHLQYEAISYCWGDTGFTKTLSIGDEGVLPLTESLYLALRALRYEDRPRLLWADAVCINQSDLAERSAQVAMMGEIFSRADRVLVWLGPCSEKVTQSLAFATLAAPLEAKGGRSREELLRLVQDHLSQTNECLCCGHGLGPRGSVMLADGLAAIAKLLESPWFERLWVVQEVALAKDVEVYCGTHHTSWYNFVEIARVPGQDGDHLQEASTDTLARSKLRQIWARCNYLNQLRARNRANSDVQAPFRPRGLCNDLLMLSYLICREPHDRIFGVSRVLGLHNFNKLSVDYSLPVAETFRRTAELFLTAPANREGGQASMMLALVGTELPEATPFPGLPSWVPNLQFLSERSRAKHTYYQWTFARRRYYADVVDFRCKMSTKHPNELLVRGRPYGVVKSFMTESCPSKHVHRRSASKCSEGEGIDLIQWYLRCRKFLQDNKSSWTSDSSAPVSDKDISGIISYAYSIQHAADMPEMSLDLIGTWVAKLGEERLKLPDVSTIAHDLRPYITGHPCDRERRLGIIDCEFGSSHAAWLPSTAQPGDSICYFAGAPESFVLRTQHACHYKLIGDAHVHSKIHHRILDMEQQPWESMLSELRNADNELKTWMESDSRSELRADADDPAKQQRLTRTHTGMKKARQQFVDQIKEVYRAADERFGWIRLQ